MKCKKTDPEVDRGCILLFPNGPASLLVGIHGEDENGEEKSGWHMASKNQNQDYIPIGIKAISDY